jgi:biopolymer transport protein ExbB
MAFSRLAFLLLIVFLLVAPMWAQEKPASKPAAQPASQGAADEEDYSTFMGKIRAGGAVGHTIIGLSVIALALAIDYTVNIRTTKLMPPGLADQARQLLQAGQAAKVDQLCQQHTSALSSVLRAGLSEIEGGWPAAEKAMEDSVAEVSAKFYRRIEYLSVIGNIAPMLGLLGTVVGMIEAFQTVAETPGAPQAGKLAVGIYKALVTTVEGLVVAIPALGAFAIFRNRVDQLVAEVAYSAQHVFSPLRRARASNPKATVAPPPVQGRG